MEVRFPSFLSSRALRNVWIAFRSEYISFGRGRERFADFIESTVIDCEENHKFFSEDDVEIAPTKSFPSPQTYYNFFRSGLAYYEVERPRNSIRVNKRTLVLILKFLYGRGGERFLQLINEPVSYFEPEVVENLDSNFLQLVPHEALPRTFALLKLGKERLTGRQHDLYEGIANKTVNVLQNKLFELHSVVCIKRGRDGPDLVELVPAERLFPTQVRKDRFGSRSATRPGAAVMFESKDFAVQVMGHRPRIEKDAFYLVASCIDKVTRKRSTESIHFLLDAIVSQLSEPEVLNAAFCDYKSEGDNQALLAAPVPSRELDTVFENCFLFGEMVK